MGQISSTMANAVKPITYSTYTGIDQLFIFYQSHESFHPGRLTASGPAAGNFDFIWTKYDGDSDNFSIPIKAEISVVSSTISDLEEGAYRVQVSNGVDIDTSFVAWVMLDDFKVWTIKDALGQVPYGESACPDDLNWIRVSGGIELDNTFYYFDLQTHDTLRISNNYDIEWTSDNPDLIIPNRTNKNAVGGNYSENPPFRDTWYILTATDSMGMTELDSVFYDTKFTKAEFTIEYLDKVTMEWDPDLSTEWADSKGSLDAPLKVRFLNTSENGFEYTWVFLDTINELTGEMTKEFEESSDKDFQPEFTYYTADKYYNPYLISISEESCIDTFFLEEEINVVESLFEVPNVFTPNGDGANPVFKFKHQSIKEFKITIVDRNGRIIYRKHIDDIYLWEGWRGTILNSDNDAPEGTYYYVIEGLGYDNREFKDPNYFERLKLERQSGGGGTAPTGSGTEPETPTQTRYTGWLYLFRGIGEY